MGPKKAKTPTKKKSLSKKIERLPVTPIPEPIEDESEDEIIDEVVESFYGQNSYDAFTKKYGIEELNTIEYSDIHREEYIIAPDDRITSEIMTLAEYTRLVSERAKQIENGAAIFIELKYEHDPIKIAELEIRKKKCPLKIIRYLTKNKKEEWSANEMVLPFGLNQLS